MPIENTCAASLLMFLGRYTSFQPGMPMRSTGRIQQLISSNQIYTEDTPNSDTFGGHTSKSLTSNTEGLWVHGKLYTFPITTKPAQPAMICLNWYRGLSCSTIARPTTPSAPKKLGKNKKFKFYRLPEAAIKSIDTAVASTSQLPRSRMIVATKVSRAT